MRGNRSSIFMCALALFFVSQAHAAAYRDMKQQIDTYSPPSDLQDLTQPAPAREKTVPSPDIAAEIKKIEDIKAQWLKSLSRADERPVPTNMRPVMP